MIFTFNRDIHICDMDIEKIDSTYFKVTIKLSDGKIIANKVNFSNTTIRQERERIEVGAYYSIAKDIYKMFLEGTCCENEDGIALSVTQDY